MVQMLNRASTARLAELVFSKNTAVFTGTGREEQENSFKTYSLPGNIVNSVNYIFRPMAADVTKLKATVMLP